MIALAVLVARMTFGQEQTGDHWTYFGTQQGATNQKEQVDLFYLADQIHHYPDGTFLVWTETVSSKAVWAHSKDVVDRVAIAINQGYFPPYFLHNVGQINTPAQKRAAAELMMDVITAERVADEGVLTPKLKVLVMLDCANQRYRLMSTMENANGRLTNDDRPTDWEYIAPDSGMSALAELACPAANSK
jgi:hypothetical protein